ncbi:uncharacterized protein LOC124671355 [Lolium rigidum]|uniref:uncharacterized protein LOC124671355 n=1 Tax=Lolium rigidum TaxID=89674 RepID=UPI001F5CD180|nr:uncharacterized protein LOC124671355 [Lolium rigidum]
MGKKIATARPGCAAGEIADDLLRDVLARLTGWRDLLRCAATCKRWLNLVTDRAFLRRAGLWPHTAPHPSVLVGVFSQNSFACSPCCFEKNYPRCPSQFFSLQAAGDDGKLLVDSFFADDDGLFSFAQPLASRRGLLLVCVHPIGRKLQLAVCRPMGDKRNTHLLPPPAAMDTIGFREHDFTGYALLTDADYGDADVGNLVEHRQQHTFRVVLNYTDRDGSASACVYSSATGSWSAPIRCHWPSALFRCGPSAGLVIHSTVHWLYMCNDDNFYTFNVLRKVAGPAIRPRYAQGKFDCSCASFKVVKMLKKRRQEPCCKHYRLASSKTFGLRKWKLIAR